MAGPCAYSFPCALRYCSLYYSNTVAGRCPPLLANTPLSLCVHLSSLSAAAASRVFTVPSRVIRVLPRPRPSLVHFIVYYYYYYCSVDARAIPLLPSRCYSQRETYALRSPSPSHLFRWRRVWQNNVNTANLIDLQNIRYLPKAVILFISRLLLCIDYY